MRMREATFVRRGIVASSGPMEVFGALVPLLIIGTFVGVLVTYSKSQFEAFTKTWADFAQARKMAMTPGRFFPFRANVITGVIENVPVQLDHYVVSHGKSSTAYTRVVSRAVEPMPFTLRVYVESVFSSLGKMLGAQDIQLGDPAFDERFMVKSDNESLTRSLLDGELRRALASFEHASLSFEYRAGAVSMTWVAREENPVVLDAAIRIAVLASRWRRPEQSLR